MSTEFSSIWHIDKTLSGVTTPGLRWPGSDGNKELLRIPQSSNITGTWYPGHLLGEFYPSAEM